MGAEIGATTSVFPFDEKMSSYLRITRRADVAALAEGLADVLSADKEVLDNPEKYYDQVIEIILVNLNLILTDRLLRTKPGRFRK
jgi:aconitate hydratase